MTAPLQGGDGNRRGRFETCPYQEYTFDGEGRGRGKGEGGKRRITSRSRGLETAPTGELHGRM